MEVRKGEGFRTFVGTRLGDKVAPIAVIDCRRASDCSWTQTGYDRLGLFNHLVGAGEDQRLDSEAERPGGLEVDDEFECGRLLNRKISRLSSLQGAVDIASGAAKDLEDAGGYRHRRVLVEGGSSALHWRARRRAHINLSSSAL